MPSLLARARNRPSPASVLEDRSLVELYQSWDSKKSESLLNDFAHYVNDGYKSNGVVFAIILARISLFSAVEFKFQSLTDRTLFGTPSLDLLETPWPNGTTGELLARMEQDVSLAGNSYVFRAEFDRLQRLRPDWVEIVTDGREVYGYAYTPGGPNSGGKTTFIPVDEMAHWSPIPDPTANFRGMSWLTPVVREINADTSMTMHKGKFFDNAATPNMLIKILGKLAPDDRDRLKEQLHRRHEGLENAYKTLVLEGGADATIIGNSMEQISFTTVQAAGENRITAAAGVPGIVVGLKEGLMAATYSNYEQAMRRWVDISMHPQWQSASSALAPLVQVPTGSRLWYDHRNIPALQQNAKAAADINFVKAQTLVELIRAGYDATQALAYVDSGEGLTSLKHTGEVYFPGPPNQPALGSGSAA